MDTDHRQHMDRDDPAYDGFRITELWVIVTVGPDNQQAVVTHGGEPLIAADHVRREDHLEIAGYSRNVNQMQELHFTLESAVDL